MKFSIGLNVLLAIIAGAFIYLYYHSTRNPPSTNTQEEDAAFWQKVQGWKNNYDHQSDSAFLISYQKFHDTVGHTPFTDPFSDIKFAALYTKTFLGDFQALGQSQDIQQHTAFTRSLWVDTGTIGKWVDYIAKNKGDGIRVYFAKYAPYVATAGDDHDPLREGRGDAGQLDNRYTCIFTVTHNVQGFHEDLISKTTSSVSLTSLGLTGTAPRLTYEGVYNYSNLCPPVNCPQTPLEQQTLR